MHRQLTSDTGRLPAEDARLTERVSCIWDSNSQPMISQCVSLAGAATTAVLWQLQSFDVPRLRVDLAQAIRGWNWSHGSFGHSLPLTTRRLSTFGARHYNNRIKRGDECFAEAPDRLDECSYFQEIFEGFLCDKTSFRILRRVGKSSYTLHTDRDIGEGVARLQIPIVTNPDVRLLVSTTHVRDDFMIPGEDYRKVDDWEAAGIDAQRMRTWLDEFVRLNADKVQVHRLEPGQLYSFDVRKYHNVWNFGDEARFTLAIDLVVNDWLCKRFPAVFQRDLESLANPAV